MTDKDIIKKVLIVEDEQVLLKTIEFTVKNRGYETVTAIDGETAIKLIKDENPDLVLLDVMIPRKNGIEVLREMREDNLFKETPVILLTNLSDEETISQGVTLGAKGYFVKADLTLDEIADKVDEILKA